MDEWKHVSSAGWKLIVASVDDGIGVLRMNRPEKRNALSAAICAEMSECLAAWERDDDVAVVVITGTEEFFSAGMDLEEYLGQPAEDRHAHMEVFHRFYRKLVDYPKPTIAAVAGPAFAGGCDLLAHCDIRVMAENALIGMPQPKYGIHSHFSPLWRLIGISRAKLMFFTGDKIDAAEAFRIGLADRLVPVGQTFSESMALARRMAALGTTMQLRLKEIALRAPTMEPISAVAYETSMYRDVCQQESARATVRAGFSKVQEHGQHGSPAMARAL